MFDIGWPELLVVAIVLIIVVGPKDLPPMLRAFGRTTTKLRAMASEFRGQFDDALREAELDDVKKTFDDARKLNPMQSIRDAVNPLKDTARDIRSDLEKTVKTPASTGSSAKVDVPEPTMKLADGPPEVKSTAVEAAASQSAQAGGNATGRTGVSKTPAKQAAADQTGGNGQGRVQKTCSRPNRRQRNPRPPRRLPDQAAKSPDVRRGEAEASRIAKPAAKSPARTRKSKQGEGSA
jgi:sec-independent protein translocase protein TatB